MYQFVFCLFYIVFKLAHYFKRFLCFVINRFTFFYRMDIDHSARYLAQKFYKIRDPDYYEFEGKS